MTHIMLSDEQSRVLFGATLPIVILDSRGTKVAEIASLPDQATDVRDMTDEEWTAECLRRAQQAKQTIEEGGTFPTTQEVLAKLRAIKPE
ncbi:MAG: hypothetical protein DCC67_20140 [Planctomycetota bacterium]|nr:MAG: hypothetical protein DCC67_20140 [Planctomycetota bacterium]